MNGESRVPDTALDLQKAALALKDAAQLIQRIANSLEEATIPVSDIRSTIHLSNPALRRSKRHDLHWTNDLIDEDVTAAVILAHMRTGTHPSSADFQAALAQATSGSSQQKDQEDSQQDDDQKEANTIRGFIRKVDNLDTREGSESPEIIESPPVASVQKSRGKRKRVTSPAAVCYHNHSLATCEIWRHNY